MSKYKKNRHKKKKSGYIKPKLLEARQKNEFLRRLKHIAKACNALDALSLLPESEIRYLIFSRFRSFRIELAPGHFLEPRLLHILNKTISSYCKSINFSIFPDGEEISLDYFYTAGMTLRNYLLELEEDQFKNATEFKNRFNAFIETIVTNQVPEKKMELISMYLSHNLSRIDMEYIWFKRDSVHKVKNPPVIYERFLMYTQKAEKKSVRFNGKTRPTYRVGWPYQAGRFFWATIRPIDLNIKCVLYNMKLEVYIQSHALQRLCERLDSESIATIYFFLFSSLLAAKTYLSNDGNTYLEFRLRGVHVGYLIIDIIQSVALIRTFLFLTNTGTPEGDRLRQNLGLNTKEKKYLEIDKLSTFVLSDFKDDARLKQVFVKSGCGHLFKLIDKDKQVESNMQIADMVARYLRLRE